MNRLLLVAMTVLLAGCQSGETPSAAPSSPAASPAYRLAPECPPSAHRPDQADSSAAKLNALVERANLPQWQAADIGASAMLSDGRIAWLFGDTVRAESLTPRVVANSLVITSGLCPSVLTAPGGGPVIPDVGPDVARWPMSVAVLRRGGHDDLVVLCSRIRRGPNGSFDFSYLGTTAVLFTVPRGGTPVLADTMELRPDSDDRYQVNWGSAATVAGDWLYVYGTRLDRDPLVFGRALFVARVPVRTPADRRGWRFWDGRGWQSDPARSAPVLPAASGVSQTLSVHPVGGGFVAVSKRGGDLANFVYTWRAPGPTGPWTPRRALPAPFEDRGKVLSYAPLGHPEIRLASGRLLISVSRNTSDLRRLIDDPTVGRPRFAEVEQP